MKIKSNNLKLKKKKKGFTLIELVAVLAIIAILSAAFLPKFNNYINSAKKVHILNEAKTVVAAYEGARYKLDDNEEITISDLISKTSLTSEDIKKLPKDLKISKCKNILDTENFDFEINSNGNLIITPNQSSTQGSSN